MTVLTCSQCLTSRMASPLHSSTMEQQKRQDTENIMPEKGKVERMNRTTKDATVKRYH